MGRQEEHQLIVSLINEEFEYNATHLVLGDPKKTLDRRLDSTNPDLRYNPGVSTVSSGLLTSVS